MLTQKQENLYDKIKERIIEGNEKDNLKKEEKDQIYEVFEFLIEKDSGRARDLWKVLNKEQKTHICKFQHLSQEFIGWKWPRMTELQKDLICLNQKLSEKFIVSKWDELTGEQRSYIFRNQRHLSFNFIKEEWPRMSEMFRNIACERQLLPKEFIRENWKKLTDEQKELVFKNQKHLSKEFVRELKTENKPSTIMMEFLNSEN